MIELDFVLTTHWSSVTQMGVYYMAPLMGPCLGPIIGGVLTSAFGWRSAFWFLVIVSGLSLASFLFLFKDTFRKERSLTYQNVLRHRLKEQARKLHEAVAKERKEMHKAHGHGSGLNSRDEVLQPHHHDVRPAQSAMKHHDSSARPSVDLEKQVHINEDDNHRNKSKPPVRMAVPASDMPEIKLSIKDVSPLKPCLLVLSRLNNCFILVASGIYFAFNFVAVYTTSRTLGTYYYYSPLKIGLVLLSFGIGSMTGSIIGGRWSDKVLARLKEKNGGKSYPEVCRVDLLCGSLLTLL